MTKAHSKLGVLALAWAMAFALAPVCANASGRHPGQGAQKAKSPKAKAPKPAQEKKQVQKPEAPQQETPKQSEATPPPAESKPGNTVQTAKAAPKRKTTEDLPPQWMERLRNMSPEEQERFLNNQERFQKLPPQKKTEIRQRLRQYHQLSPEERAKLQARASVWEKISPEQRKHVSQDLLPKWKQMPPDRRKEIRRRLTALNGLNEDERSAKLSDPAFVDGLSPSEQSMLKELSGLRVMPGPGS